MFGKYYLWKWIESGMLIISFAECKVPYDPPVNSSGTHFLVVEGYINAKGITNIKLSRTRTISPGDTAAYINETGANVVIEDDKNNVYHLNETGAGNYSDSFDLDLSNQYRLHIVTADNKNYRSDFVACKVSPPIQKLYWDFNEGSVWVYIDTHDPANNTHYYRWAYIETWEYHSQYYSVLKYQPFDTTVVARASPVFVCYRTQQSPDVLLKSTTKLQQDAVDKQVLVFIPTHDRRISVLYSVLITQYALDSIAYNYWSAMKNNSVNIGSIFGSQPNQTMGNIHNINDTAEKVIGYVGAGVPAQTRIFISNSSMPPDWNEKPNCAEMPVAGKKQMALYFRDNSFIPIYKDTTLSGKLIDYFSASGRCVDCTLNGGTTVKPAFWP